MVRIEFDSQKSLIHFLSWDTEGGDRAKMNLLRPEQAVQIQTKSGQVNWQVRTTDCAIEMTFTPHDAPDAELHFPFNPLAAATTVLPAAWDDQDKIELPAIISAPDFGQMRLHCKEAKLKARLVGDRANHILDFIIELPARPITLTLEPVILPTPSRIDESNWNKARRGWWNAIEPSARWSNNKIQNAPAGVLANNVLSDPVSCLMHLWADQILLTPRFDAGIHLPDLIRRTIDWWIDHRTKPSGEVYAYWDHADMLDANASPLIAAWDYLAASGDRDWLRRRIDKLEFIANYLLKRDIDGDGLIESTHSGNYGTLIEPMRAGSAWDTINAGHKDAYCNVLIYRALRCLADLESQLDRHAQQKIYARQADQLKAAYVKTFFNPATGWLMWWKSLDGQMHDISAPMITNLAICYGLVDPEQGKQMLDHLWAKIESVGFKRFDLGIPITLAPIRRGDYLIGLDTAGVPKKEDGSDTFGQYLNGGCVVSDAVYFITALHICGQDERGDRVLNAMLDRQAKGVFPNGGAFQNGVVNQWPKGAEFFTWDGQTTGYEGHLTYSFAFLQAVFLRDPVYRAKLLRPVQ